MADKNSKKAIRSDIEATTIVEELKLMYLMAGATQSVVEDVMKRLRGIYSRIDNHVINCTWGMGRDEEHPDAPGDAEAYDSFTQDQLEVVRLLMLYVDRTARNNDAFAKVFATLRKLPENGIFKDEDIARFKMKKTD